MIISQEEIHDFIETVSKMRKYQKQYFRERAQSAMVAAMGLEKRVDNMIESLTCIDKLF